MAVNYLPVSKFWAWKFCQTLSCMKLSMWLREMHDGAFWKDLLIRANFTKSIQECKAQIKPNADWRAIDSPKKLTNEFVFFLPWQSGNTWNLIFFSFTVWKYLNREIEISSRKYLKLENSCFKCFRTVKQKTISFVLFMG